jgi:hypothetical protein
MEPPTNGGALSGFEGVFGFTVVGEVAEVVDGIFEEGSGCKNRQADGCAGEGAGDGEGEASGFAKARRSEDGFRSGYTETDGRSDEGTEEGTDEGRTEDGGRTSD